MRFIDVLDQIAAPPRSSHIRYGAVTSITAPYSSNAPNVRLDNQDPATAVSVRINNYSGIAVGVGDRVAVLVTGADMVIVGKKP